MTTKTATSDGLNVLQVVDSKGGAEERTRTFTPSVRDWLGHRDVSTTDRYLATDGVRLQEAARRIEEAQGQRGQSDSDDADRVPRAH